MTATKFITSGTERPLRDGAFSSLARSFRWGNFLAGMKMILLGVSLAVATVAWGDGLPFSEKEHKVLVPHTVLALNASQVEEAEALGTLTLTADQWGAMRKIGPSCPKRFETLYPFDLHDNVGETEPYVIMLSRTTAAILHDDIKALSADYYSIVLWQQGNLELKVDNKGQFYFEGKLIAYPRLLQAIAKRPACTPGYQYPSENTLRFSIPVGMSRESDSLKTRLNEVESTARKAGWK